MITNRATNDGYGLAHIEARHGEEIRKAGYKSVLDFIEQVAKNYDVIKEGNMRDGRPTYRLMLTDKHNNTLMVELSGDGTFWNINTAGIFKTSYGRKNREVYNRHTTVKQSAETTETSQDAEQSDTQAPSRMNVPTTSESEDTKSKAEGQEKSEESKETSLSEQISTASAEVNTNPTEAQKEAGNNKKGHVQVGTFDITIEQPQGSIRRGKDANGKKWESKMHNTYGYFRGTEGVDGDHIDVFLSNDIDGWNGRKVFVVDQYNPDGTFDEHKVMLGFNDIDEAKSDYLANYEKGWENGRRIDVTPVSLEDFEKWIGSSHRKTKAFAEYAGVKKETEEKPLSEKGGKVPFHKAGESNGELTKAEVALRDAVIDRLRENGIDVVTDVSEGQRVLDMANGNVEETRLMSVDERKERIEQINKISPERVEDKPTTRKEARSAYAELKPVEKDGATVEFYNSAFGKAWHGEDCLFGKIIPKIREIFKSSVLAYSETDNLGGKQKPDGTIHKKHPNIKAFHNYVGKVIIGNKPYYVRFTVQEGTDAKQGTHNFFVSDISLYNNTVRNVTTDTNNTLGNTNTDGIVDAKLKNFFETSDGDGQKFSYHRVYHGSGADFEAFDHSHMGEGEGAQAYGWGTYVTEVEGIGRTYAISNTTKRNDALRALEHDIDAISAQLDMHRNGLKNDEEQLKRANDWRAEAELDYELFQEKAEERKKEYGEDSPEYRNLLFNDIYTDEMKRAQRSVESTEDSIRYRKEKIAELEKALNDKKAEMDELPEKFPRHLYSVEIPDDNGKNYLDWNERLSDSQIEAIRAYLSENYRRNKLEDFDASIAESKGAPNADEVNAWARRGENVYKMLSHLLGSDDAASKALSEMGFAGIKYPAENRSGGRKDGARNYVIFNENDAKIVDKVRFFKTQGGEAYGFTVGGKIYIDPHIASSETAVHEYAHLWAEALRSANAKEWANVVGLMRGTSVWNEVMERYPELKSDDEIADEVLATYSGRRGSERLREEMDRIKGSERSVADKARALGALERVRRALDRFWHGVADFLGIHYKSADEVADRVMRDLLNGVDPRKFVKGESDGRVREQFIGEDGVSEGRGEQGVGKPALQTANERFNSELTRYQNGEMAKNEMLHLGRPQGVMRTFLPNLPIVMRQRILTKGSVGKHNVAIEALADMPSHLSHPIFVFERSNNALGVLTEMQDRDGKNVCVAIELSRKIQNGGEILEVNDVRSVHGRNVADIVYPIVQNGTLKWVDKEKGLTYLSSASRYVQQEIDKQDLNTATKVVENFENPKLSEENQMESDNIDREYLQAVKEGDMEKAQRMVNEAAKRAGYSESSDYQGTSAFIGSAPYGNGWFLTKEERKEAWDNDEWDGYSSLGDYIDNGVDGGNIEELTNAYSYRAADPMRKEAIENVRDVVENKKKTITMYRSVPSSVKEGHFRNGDWVTPSKKYAIDNARIHGWENDYRIIEQEVPVDDVWFDGNDIAEWGYGRAEDVANEKDFGYKNTKNNRKLLDPVTYDDNGNVIPLSERFNEGSGDIRFRDEVDGFVSSSVVDGLRERAVELGRELGADVDVVSDVSEITDPNPEVQERKRRAKGWYDAKTGRVVINLAAHSDMADVEQTLLHEIVGHRGLRGLVGHENFNGFLDGIYEHASDVVREGIDDIARRKGCSKRVATEEYMSGLAEGGFADRKNAGLWQQIRQWFSDMLSRAKIKLNFSISDNELRYLLWRSHELSRMNGREGVVGRARDLAMQNRLGVGNGVGKAGESAVDSYDGDLETLFRDADSPVDYERALIRDSYERRLKDAWFQSREALQDGMLSLKETMKDIWRSAGKKFSQITDIPDYANPYIGQNRLSSRNAAEVRDFKHNLFRPLLREVGRLTGFSADGRAKLTDYMMAKHGLERNKVMAERVAKAAYEAEKLKDPNTTKTLADFVAEYRKKDYSGLTSLTGLDDVAAAEAEAKNMVADYEANHDTANLWARTKAVTDAIVQKQYDSGYINSITRNAILNMYDNYIPLRGFEDKTAEDVYSYMKHSNSAFNAPIKTARGRKSKADDPFANMLAMAESGIMRGNRNKLVKLPLLSLVLEHPTDLISVSDVWFALLLAMCKF